VFTSAVCGVDGSRASLEAARQAARLTVAGGDLTLVAVVDFLDALALRRAEEERSGRLPDAEPDASELSAAMRERAGGWLDEAARQIGAGRRIETRVCQGRPADALHDEAVRAGTALLAVGAHGRSRLLGLALGHTSSLLLHEAPCAVMVARPSFDPAAFPLRAIVGVDGSPASGAAVQVARAISRAHGTALDVVAAGEQGLSSDDARRAAAPATARIVPERPVEALVAAAEEADLLVVGRGGDGALGSVSERVAHRASCSVLVVRGFPQPNP
jgi:nucleotide-binding universal stress UspA family protein